MSDLFARAKVTTPAVRATAYHFLKTKGPGGTMTYEDIQSLGYTRQTAITVAKRLCGLKVLTKVTDGKGGRGQRALFRITWGLPKGRPSQIADPVVKINCKVTKDSRVSKHSKDACALRVKKAYSSLRANGNGVNGSKSEGDGTGRRAVSCYTGASAEAVVLLMGARFYRESMMRTRLSLESWGLPTSICDSIEGLIGKKIDGMTLAEARRLVQAVLELRGDILKIVGDGATARKVCSFICGQLTRWWRRRRSRSKRELLKRTNELLRASRAACGLGSESTRSWPTRTWSCRRCQARPIERDGLCVRCYNDRRRDEYQRTQPRQAHPNAARFLRLYYADSEHGSAAQEPNKEGMATGSTGERAEARCRRCGRPGRWAYALCDECRRELVYGARLIKAS